MEQTGKWGTRKIIRENAYGKGKIKKTQHIPNFPASLI